MALIGSTSLPSPAADLVVTNAACDSGVVVGDWVRWQGTTLIKAQADNMDNSNVLGLVESKNSPVLATVRIGGVSAVLFTGLDREKEYLLSSLSAGTMTPQGVDVPSDSGNVILILGKPVDGGRFLVRPGTRIKRF